MPTIRTYRPEDYEGLKALYLQSDLYGGQFDEARDSREKIAAVTARDPESILICEEDGVILGSISLIENGRVAWLFRFAVVKSAREKIVTEALHNAARAVLSARGHSEVLVYSPAGHPGLTQRYLDLGMNKGSAYDCFWQAIATK